MSDDLTITAQGLPAPAPSELASLAIQLLGGRKVEKNPAEAMKRAAAVWIAARCRCEVVEEAEVYRRTAIADLVREDARGELTQDEVMKLAEIGTEAHFLKRAKKFFGFDWGRVEKHEGGLPMFIYPRLGGFRDSRQTLARVAGIVTLSKDATEAGFEIPPRAERRWHKTIAAEFVVWLKQERTERARRGGEARAC